MGNGIYTEIKYFIACEWLLLLLGFSMLIFHKQFFEIIDGLLNLLAYILVSLTGLLGFVFACCSAFMGNLGMQGSYYISDFLTNHMLPWIIFIIIYDFIDYFLPKIIFIMKQNFILGKEAQKLEDISYISMNERVDFVFSSPTVILLQ